MLIREHCWIGLLITIAVFNHNFYYGLLFFLSLVIIDIDHIISYWYYTSNFSLNYFKIKRWCLYRGGRMNVFLIFHNLWFLLLLTTLATLNSLFWFIILGVLTHYILDIIWDAYKFLVRITSKPYRRWFT